MKSIIPAENTPDRLLQGVAFTIAALFILGFVYPVIGAWTGATISAWFIGTQRAVRGGLVMVGLAVVPNLFSSWHQSSLAGIDQVFWVVLAALISVLPYCFYRLTIQRGQGFLSTLSLPLLGTVFQSIGQRLLPLSIFAHFSLAQSQQANAALVGISGLFGACSISFLIYWSAAVFHWLWNHEFDVKKIGFGAGMFTAAWLVLIGSGNFFHLTQSLPLHALISDTNVTWVCLIGGLVLSSWTFFRPCKLSESWAQRTDTLQLLRSPCSVELLNAGGEHGHQVLVSRSGETFPIQRGIPQFQKPAQLTGSNQKYHRLYEMIGGFYDDSQRVGCAMMGIRRDQIFLSYLKYLEIRPGDSILETSVGTGLNLKYLPRDTRLFGLDLSAEMLAACQNNLQRWGIEATLLQGNAEELPFANDSLDIVFHVGGINFFNDRAKAIREMIRVAKPGSRILIADETEKYVSSAYERTPITRKFFKDRQKIVTAPIDLVPTEMLETQLEILWDGRFYALTFRKPFPMLNTREKIASVEQKSR